jgi:hypothetical protein
MIGTHSNVYLLRGSALYDITPIDLEPGAEIQIPYVGYSAGLYSEGVYGFGDPSLEPLRLFSSGSFGQDLLFVPRGKGLYVWKPDTGVSSPAVRVDSLEGASEVPTVAVGMIVSDVSRFVLCFGASDIGSTELLPAQNPLLIRWSDQENYLEWMPRPTNQAGSIELSRGTAIITALQARQEIVVFTDASVYVLQYVGAPIVWSSQLVGDNISIVSPNSAVFVGSSVYWMGRGTFYVYSGQVTVNPCSVRSFVFNDINQMQADQIFAVHNEAFSEVWWFYPSSESNTVDKYVIYNYKENLWYYGTMARTAAVASDISDRFIATDYAGNLIEHEFGTDDLSTPTPQPIHAYVASGDVTLGEGDRFSFISQVIPDLNFDGSQTETPSATFSLQPRLGPGSPFKDPASEGGASTTPVQQTIAMPVPVYADVLAMRARARSIAIKVESTELGVAWQLGTPRVNIRADGRRG